MRDKEQRLFGEKILKLYKIIDKEGIEIPRHHSGRYRTYDEANKIIIRLNRNGDNAPYEMIEI